MKNNDLFAIVKSGESLWFFMKFGAVIIVSILLFFNDWPRNDFEVFIYDLLLKNVGFYSHIYPFQSILISNFIAFFVPVISFYIFIKVKVVYLTSDEIKEYGMFIHKGIALKIIRFILFWLFLSGFIFLFIYTFFFDLTDLEELRTSTTFFGDNIIVLFLLPYLHFLLFIIWIPTLLSQLVHPIIFFSSDVYTDPDTLTKRDRILSKLKKHYKNQREKNK